MIKMMNRISSTAMLAVAFMLCATSAWANAPTPTAVWQTGEFMRQKNGYSITLNGNAINKDGNIVIKSDASAGVTIDVTDVLGNAGRDMSVLIKYSNATLPASEAVFVCVLNDNSGTYDTGLKSTASNNGALTGYWNSTAPYGVGAPNPTTAGSGYLLYSYKHDTENGVTKGVYAYNGSAISNMSGGSNSGLCWPGRRLHKIAIGGPSGSISGTYAIWPNLIIEKIAIFVGSVYTNTQMSEYTFPSEVQVITVNSNTSVSAINDQLDDENYDYIAVLADDGITIDVDQAFDKIISVACEGSVTLSANSQPDASYFSGVDFTGVQGGLLRSWLTPGVVGFNFNANGGRNAQGNTDGAADTALALEIGTWYKDAYSASGSSTAMFSDGLSLLTWKANNVYAERDGLTSGTFIQGYLDDGKNVSISLACVPYETYDIIIYCSTDDSSKSFKAKRVNGTIYTWDSTAGETTTTDSDTDKWGLASAAAGKAVYGANTLRINNLTGPLSIKGGTNGNNARGCISAIQIMPAGTSTAPEMTVGTAEQTTQANWTDALWNVATAPTSGNVIINVSGDVELTVDETVALSAITVTGAGSLKLIPNQQNSVTLTASSISSTVPLIFANDGIGIDTISASVTYLYKTTSIASSSYGNTYTAGVGEQGSSVTISHNGGSVTLQGATYYLGESHNATATTVTFDDATAVYSSDFGVGMATYVVEGSSSISAQRLILSQGDSGRTAAMTVKDTASINVTGTSDVDSNQASIMFGHWNGPSTFTIQDSATFTAASQVLVGKTANNHTINIDGGTFTAKGIKTAGYASGTNTLNLNGGLLVLGDVGITSYSTSTTIGVNVLDDSEIRAYAATLPITQSLTVSEDATLSFTKDSGIVATAVSLTGAVSGSGNISVGPGVTLNLGTNRPAGEIAVDADGVLTVVMTNKGDVPVLKVSSEPSTVILYDTDGTTVLDDATVDYDNVAGTISVKPPVPRWTTESDSGSFDTAANWSTDSVPTSGDVVIELSQDTTISVSETYTLSSLIITGTGTATLSGTGTITAGTVYVVNGATLTQDGHINATSISLDSGTVLKLNGVTESAVISGAGAVETYGTVVLAAANSMTGGITVKSGSSLSTSVEPIWEVPSTKAKCNTGFGPYNKDSAYSAQSRVVVENGGCVDINNVANKDAGVALTISGKGILNGGVYSGAVKYSGSGAIGNNSRQISSLSLAADAMVDVGLGCGLVHSGHSAASLALNGHTLTMRGTGTVPMVNVTANAGTLVMDGATLQLSDTASNFTGVNVVAKGCATINIATAPSAIGSLTLKPSASGTTASAWNLPAGLVPAVDASNIDPSGLSDDEDITLFTAPNETTLTDSNISANIGSRYETTISGNTVTATVKAGCPTNFMHYDFNAENSIASDSTYNIGNLNPFFVETRNGKAGRFDSSSKPYYDSNTSSKSPFYAGEMTITTLLKPMEANNTILWNFGSAFGSGIALIAKDSSTLALVSWTGDTDGTDVVSVSEVAGLLNNWHLVTIVANSRGTTLYVDNKSASVSTVLPSGISGQGQFGSIHGKVKNYNAVSGSGFLLDDWRVYDAALTASEIETIKVELVAVTITVPDVANTTVSVTVGGVEQVGVDGDGVKTYSVSYGSAVVVTYAAASGCRISGTTTYNIASATEDSTIAVDANLHSDPLVARITGSEIDYTLQEAVTASSVGDTIMLLDNCAETAVDTTGKDFIFNENGHAFSGTWTGSGRIVLSAAPSTTTWSSSLFVADGWTGTVTLDWGTIDYRDDSVSPKRGDIAGIVNKYGIAASTVEIGQNSKTEGNCYFNGETTPKLKVSGFLYINDGSSTNKRTIGNVCGDGVFVFGSKANTVNYGITNLNDWNGILTNMSAKVTIGTITRGNGVVYCSNKPSSVPTFTTSEGNCWTGRFIADWSSYDNPFNLHNYGIEGSIVEVTKTFSGHFDASAGDVTISPTIDVSGSITINNGYSGNIVTLTKVIGSGTLTFSCIYTHNITTLQNWDGDLTYSSPGSISKIESGSGKVVSSNRSFTPTIGADWSGSFVMNWTPAYAATPSSTAWVLDDYGVSGSTVVIAQAIEHGYLKDKSSATAPSIAPAVYLKANLTVDNGFYNATTTFSQLGADDGVVFTTRSSGDGTPYAVTLLKDFAGSFNLLYGSCLTIDTIERDALPSVGDLVVSATAQTGSSTPASFNVASTKIRVGGVDTVVPLAYSTSVAVDESGLYKAVAQISTTYYATMQEAITVAGDSNLASITVLDGSAAMPDGYYINNGVVTKCPVALVTSGASVYKTDVQSAIIAAGVAVGGYDYIEILVGGNIDVPLNILASLKIKNTGGATLAFTGVADDCDYDEDASNPAYTVYTMSNKPTTYTWAGGVEDTFYPGSYMWAEKRNWRYVNNSSETVTASRQPQAGDSVTFNKDSVVTIVASATVAAITVNSGATCALEGSFTSLSLGTVTANAGTLIVTAPSGVTPTYTLGAFTKVNIADGSAGAKVYTFSLRPGTIFSVY